MLWTIGCLIVDVTGVMLYVAQLLMVSLWLEFGGFGRRCFSCHLWCGGNNDVDSFLLDKFLYTFQHARFFRRDWQILGMRWAPSILGTFGLPWKFFGIISALRCARNRLFVVIFNAFGFRVGGSYLSNRLEQMVFERAYLQKSDFWARVPPKEFWLSARTCKTNIFDRNMSRVW